MNHSEVAVVAFCLFSIMNGCGNSTTTNYYGGTGGGATMGTPTGGAPAYDFPVARTECTDTPDTVNCEEMTPRCASSTTKCLPSSGSFPFSCAYTRRTGANIKCECYDGEEKLCYTDAGALGTQACNMDPNSNVISTLDPNCVPIPQP